MRVSAVASDLDGTLLTKEEKICDSSVDYLRKLAHTGCHIILASGRSLTEITILAEMMPDTFYIVACNGSIAAKFTNNETEILHTISIANDAMLTILNVFNGIKIPYYVHDGTVSYVSTSDAEKLFKKEGLSDISYLEDFTVLENILKITFPLYLFDESTREHVILELSKVNTAQLNVQVVNSNDWLDIIPLSAGKSQGLKFLSNKLGINMDEIISFGDGGNDICMLSSTGYSIAPKNGCPEAKKAAKAVSQWTNEESCVVKELQKILPL
jgi:hypothetical protein